MPQTTQMTARYLTFNDEGRYTGTGVTAVALHDVDLTTTHGLDDAYYAAALQVLESDGLPGGSAVAVSALHPSRTPGRTTAGAERFPDGRVIYYEGDDPTEFVTSVKAEMGFDPSADPRWGEHVEYDKDRQPDDPPGFTSYAFHCPPEHLNAIYYSERWLMGS